ncbi:MAG: PHB depolymerase family esterase [Bacteroidia bacterium]
MTFKKIVAIIFISILFFNALHAAPLKEIENFGKNPGNLKLFSFNDSVAKNNAVVFVLHGCSQTASGIEAISDWQKLAVKNRFALFYPQQKTINNSSHCFNWFLNSDINKNGECLSMYNMMRYAIDSLKADSTQIYFYGVSAGACMAEVMCANYPWLVNSAAICAGIPFKTATGLKTLGLMGKAHLKSSDDWGDLVRHQNMSYSGKFPKIIVVHGTKDIVANFGYAEEIIKQWTNVNGIKRDSAIIFPNFEGNNLVERKVYGSYKIKNAVTFYKITGMSHKLPVDAGEGEKQGGKDKLFSDDIDFFMTYYIAKDFNLIK